MACHVLQSTVATECEACALEIPPGRVVITDEIHTPFFVVVCDSCAVDLAGGIAAARRAAMGTAGRRQRRPSDKNE